MKYKFILFSPWLLKSPVFKPYTNQSLSPEPRSYIVESFLLLGVAVPRVLLV